MKGTTTECRKGGPRELLYADDLVFNSQDKRRSFEHIYRLKAGNGEERTEGEHGLDEDDGLGKKNREYYT